MSTDHRCNSARLEPSTVAPCLSIVKERTGGVHETSSARSNFRACIAVSPAPSSSCQQLARRCIFCMTFDRPRRGIPQLLQQGSEGRMLFYHDDLDNTGGVERRVFL